MTDLVPGTTAMVRRALLSLVLGASLITALAYHVGATARLAALSRSGNDLLGTIRGKTPPGSLPDISAVAADPLDQKAVNGVIVARAQASGDLQGALREAGLLRQLGWRNTAALQNLLWRAGTTTDQPLMMDTLDALLRRERLLGQIYPILNLMTTDPQYRGILARRLAGRPPWRRYYFMSANDLVRPQEIEGRYLVMRGVQKNGDPLSRNEVAPVLPKLVGIGRARQAFELWQAHGAASTSPLADTDFAVAARPLPSDALPVSFEWQLASGAGFFADAGRDGRGSFMSIDWNGRGVPVFAGQLTTARAGRYRLDVTGEAPMAAVARRLAFRLVCADGRKTEFQPVGVGRGRHMRLASVGAVPCDFPTLELFGLIQPAISAAPIMLHGIRLERIG